MKTKYVEAPLTEFLHQKASRMLMPLSGTFEITPVCNMSCRMCYVRMSKAEQEAIRPLRTAQEWIRLGEIAKEKGMLYLLLTGGEPFSRPDFREIMEGLHRLGLLISINSNATLIDDETVAWLKEVPPTRMNITLYGASNETYARLCRNPQGFTQVTHAIHLLKEAGISIKINCSVTPHNADDLEEIFAFCEREGLIIQATSYMFPPLRRNASMIGKNERFTPEEAAWYSAKIEYLSNGKERFLEHVAANDLEGLPVDQDSDCQDIEGEGMRCRAGKCSFWVTWDGRFLPCGMLPATNAPDVFQIGFDEAWKQVTEEAAAIRLPAKCKNCKIKDTCRACAATVLTETGNYHTVPKYRCQMAQAYFDAVNRMADFVKENTD
ncbi:MAG: radical SAM protein [Lachnospiraceae bacterium]|nr:radical SAM protein [Lachnospiraceae bacterium]